MRDCSIVRAGAFSSAIAIPSTNQQYCEGFLYLGNAGRLAEICLPIKLTFKFLLDLDIPKLNTSSQQTIKENSSFAISCASVGSPSATYQWSKSGAIVSNSAVLSFPMVNRVDIGAYSCNATNAFGSKVSMNLNLNVQCMSILILLSSTTENVQAYQGCF